jgi:hypothetical protein
MDCPYVHVLVCFFIKIYSLKNKHKNLMKAKIANRPTSPKDIRMSVLMGNGDGLGLIMPVAPGTLAAK